MHRVAKSDLNSATVWIAAEHTTKIRVSLHPPRNPPLGTGKPLWCANMVLTPYDIKVIIAMNWTVEIGEELEEEWNGLPFDVQNEILAHGKLLEQFGPQLGRPRVDTLKESKHANMKELRFDAADGVWRVAFVFDPHRRAILLVAGDKSGGSQRRFYKQLIAKADARYATHLAKLKTRR